MVRNTPCTQTLLFVYSKHSRSKFALSEFVNCDGCLPHTVWVIIELCLFSLPNNTFVCFHPSSCLTVSLLSQISAVKSVSMISSLLIEMGGNIFFSFCCIHVFDYQVLMKHTGYTFVCVFGFRASHLFIHPSIHPVLIKDVPIHLFLLPDTDSDRPT